MNEIAVAGSHVMLVECSGI